MQSGTAGFLQPLHGAEPGEALAEANRAIGAGNDSSHHAVRPQATHMITGISVRVGSSPRSNASHCHLANGQKLVDAGLHATCWNTDQTISFSMPAQVESVLSSVSPTLIVRSLLRLLTAFYKIPFSLPSVVIHIFSQKISIDLKMAVILGAHHARIPSSENLQE